MKVQDKDFTVRPVSPMYGSADLLCKGVGNCGDGHLIFTSVVAYNLWTISYGDPNVKGFLGQMVRV